MKKFLFFLATLLAFCLNWASCSEGGSDNAGNEGGGSGNNQSSITLSKDLLEFDSNNGYQTIIVTSSDNWTVTGGADWCDISPSSGSTGKNVSITVDENTSDKDRTATFTFTCGNQSAKLTVTQYGIIETSYVELKLNNDDTELSYNEQTGETVITYANGSVPQIEQGQSFVLTNDYGYDIRKIVSYSASGNKLTIKTEPGNMCDLFKNISFTLTTNPNMTASARSTGRVITPTSIKVVNGKSLKEVYSRNNSMTTDVYENTNARLKYDYDFGKQIVEEGDFGKIEWTKGIYNIDMDAVFSFDFGEKIINQTKTGELKDFKYYLDGNIDLDFYLDYKTGDTSAGFEKKEIIKEKVLPSIILEFMVGTIPVVLTLDADLGTQITSTNVDAETIIQGGFQLNTKTKLGLEYNAQQNVSTISEHDSKFAVNNPAFKIQGLTEAQASIFPHLGFKLYKSQGPWMEFIPSLKMNANGTSETAEYQEAGWNAGINATTETVLGLNLDAGIFGSDSITPINNTLSEDTLFKAPYCILLESPKNTQPIQVNEEVELCFHVQGKDYMSGDSINCPNALIEYGIATTDETNFNTSGQIVTDENGRAKIKWTPTNTNQRLVAKLIGANGETIDKVEFKPTVEDKRRTLLEIIYKQTNGDNWKNNHNWLTDAPIEDWYGVSTDEKTGKISLILADNNLTGSIDLDMTIDSNQTGIHTIQKMSLVSNQIENIRLIGHQSLETLYCQENPLDKVNVSGCINIKELDLKYNDINNSFLNYLNVSNCTSLEKLSCTNSRISSLILTGCTSLKELDCAYTSQLKDISTIQDCKKLTSLNINNSHIKNLVLIDFKELEELDIRDSALETLNLTGCSKLKEIHNYNGGLCDALPNIRTMILSGCNSLQAVSMNAFDNDYGNLTHLDISGCENLVELDCLNHPLKELNISGCIALESIKIFQAQLTNLNLSECKSLRWSSIVQNNYLAEVSFENLINLEEITCTHNEQLTSLNVSGCSQLETLHCQENKLINLNASGLSNLRELLCYSNQLINLDVTGCTKLEKLYCMDNRICSVIPDWFSQFKHYFDFAYDVRFTDYWWEKIFDEQGQLIDRVLRYTDNGVGWWYPGEPEKGYHGRDN